ncbi:MAG: peptidylprolyl isomerase [bacterium]|mgnify:FL=1
MKIQKESHVTMDYKLSLESGEVVDKSQPNEPIEFICGYSQIIPGLEKELMGRKESESFQAVIQPEDGYGEYVSELIQKVPISHFPEDLELKVGMTFQSKSPQGMPVTFVVSGIDNDMAEIDLNHPLAGKTLVFDIVIKSVRQASQEEIEEINSMSSCDQGDASQCGGGCSCGG